MRVALLVGVLMFDMLVGFYEIGWIDGDASSDAAGEVQALEDTFPPPPSWP